MRYTSIDGIRGYLLIFMMWGHAAYITKSALGQLNHRMITFADAAHGFFFVSGLVLGLVMTAKLDRDGTRSIFKFVRRRLLIIYSFHSLTISSLLLLYFLEGSAEGHLSRIMTSPPFELFSLQKQPFLLEILPIYLVFIAASPAAILLASCNRSITVLLISVIVWLLAQFGFWRSLGLWLDATLGYPFLNYGGPFEVFAWQLLFTSGLLIGHAVRRRSEAIDRLRTRINCVLPALVGIFLVLSTANFLLHLEKHGFVSLPPAAATVMETQSKWALSPLYLLSFGVTAALVFWICSAPDDSERRILRAVQRLVRNIVRHRIPVSLGRASLSVFTAHVLILYLVGTTFDPLSRPEWMRFGVLLMSTVALFAVPWIRKVPDMLASSLSAAR